MTSNKEICTALVKAQAEMSGAKKDSANPFFKSKYADLSSVDAAIGPAAAKHGLAYIQISHNIADHAAIETVILHESGQVINCGIVAVPVSKADAQGYGSAMTYARRYSLSAAFGVCPEDDDGNAAAKAKPLPNAVNPNDVGKDFWSNATGEQKECLESYLRTLLDYLDNADFGPEAASIFFYTKLHDLEEASAVWSQLNSKQRAAIKAHKPATIAKE